MVGQVQTNPTSGTGSTTGSGAATSSGSSGSGSSVQDTLSSSSLTVDTSVFELGTPNLSILDFQQTVGAANQAIEKQLLESYLIDSTVYADLRIGVLVDTALVIQRLHDVNDYLAEYQKVLNDYNTNIAPVIAQAGNTYNSGNTADNPTLTDTYGPNAFFTFPTTPGSDGFNYTQNPSASSIDQLYSYVGGDADRQMQTLTADSFASDPEYQTFIKNVNTSISEYNTHANRRNSEITTYNSAVTKYNSLTSAFNAQVDQLNALKVSLNLTDVPTLSDLPTLSTLSAWPTLPSVTAGTWSQNNATPPVNSIASQSPAFGASAWNIPSLTFNSNIDTAYLLTPPVAPSFTYTLGSVNTTSFTNEYVAPLLLILSQVSKIQQQATNQLTYLSYYRLQFGQTAVGLPPQLPTNLDGSAKTDLGPGTAVASLANDPTVLSNPNLSQILSNSLLNLLYNRLGVSAGSPIIPEADKIMNHALNLSAFSAIPWASQFLHGVSSSGSPQADAVQGALSLSFLQQAQGIVANQQTAASLFKALFQNLSLAGLSQEDLAKVANGIGAALNVQLLSVALFQLSQAIGASGLLPQVLASLGSMSPDEINSLLLGKINFLNLNDNPVTKQELQQLLQEELAKNGLDDETAQTGASNAILAASSASDNQTALQNIQGSLFNAFAANNSTSGAALESSNAITSLLSDPVQLAARLDQVTKEDNIKNEIRAELTKNGLDTQTTETLLTGNTFTNNDQAILSLFNKAGVPSPENSAQTVLSLANNPLRSTQVTAPLTNDELTSALTSLLYKPFNLSAFNNGVIGDKISEVAKGFVDGPQSVSNLLKLNLQAIQENTRQEKFDQVAQNFADFMAPKTSLVAFVNELLDPAKMLVFLDKVQYQGIVGKVAGPGAPSGFGYLPSTNQFI